MPDSRRMGLGLCGLLMGILLTLLFIFMLTMPWYYNTFRLKVFRQDLTMPFPAEDDCKIRYFIGWDSLHCSYRDECNRILDVNFLNLICPDDSVNWRDTTDFGFDTDNTQNVYNVSVALISVAFFLVLLMTISSILLALGIITPLLFALLLGGLGILALIFLTTSIAYFPTTLPSGLRDDNFCTFGFFNLLTVQTPWIPINGLLTSPGPTTVIFAENTNTPCEDFLASNTFVHIADNPPQSLQVESEWGGAGYWITIGTWPVLLLFTLYGLLAMFVDGGGKVFRDYEDGVGKTKRRHWYYVGPPVFVARAVLAEFLATMFLVYIGPGAAVTSGGVEILTGGRITAIALAFGLVIALGVYAAAHHSGGHINPAITLACMVTLTMPPLKGLLYMIAQFSGGLLGAALLYGSVPAVIRGTLAANEVQPGVSLGQAFLLEFVLTFLLVFVVFATAVDPKADVPVKRQGFFAPLAIGFAVLVAHLVGIPITNTGINPARSFATAVVGNFWEDQWIFYVAPFAAGIAAGIIYKLAFMGLSSFRPTYMDNPTD